jgi:predicted NBD/HSP70 family sugar kinase
MDASTIAVLRSIYRSQPTTRRALIERTGLRGNRISATVGQLVAQGLVREETGQAGTPGRPAHHLSLEPGAGRIVGLDIGGLHSWAVLCDLSGRVVCSITQPTEPVPDRAAILDGIMCLVRTVCREGGETPQRLMALGVGVRGIVDAQTGIVLGWPNTPAWANAWTGVNLPLELGHLLGNDLIVVEDSVRTMGINAHRWGQGHGSTNFLYVFLGTGVGSALLINGEPYHGGMGLAGELGHVTVEENGPRCSCGNRGCLEVLASTSAVLQRVRERLAESYLLSALREPFQRGEVTLEALIGAARAGDKIAFQVLDETGTYVGKVVAIALNLLAPELVVLGGPLVQSDDIVLAAVRRQVRLRALQHIANRTHIVSDDQGELAGARGAALLATDALFNSEQRLRQLVT